MTQLRQLARNEHSLIGDIIADSFADDPVALWLFGGPIGIKHYISKVAQKLYLKQGFGFVVDKAKNSSGGALWLPPGVKKKVPLINSIDIALPMIKHSGLWSIPRGIKVDNALCHVKPMTPHYFLFAIGTRPSQQGKGVGGRLMEAGLKKVDAARMPAYLESSKESNIPFYRSYGFEVMERFVPTTNCPPLWLMWRAPQ